MGQTERFGFETFGGDQGGDISDRGYKFSIRDRQIIDAVLRALEVHEHDGGVALVDPVGAPVITLDQDDLGQLPAGTDLFYRVSFIDIFGLETAASDEYTIRTPDALVEPMAPALAAETGAGTISRTGTYQYAISVRNDAGQETMVGLSSSVRVRTGHNQVRIFLPVLPDGGVGYNVYRLSPNESEFLLIAETELLDEEWLDTGLPADTTRPLPAANLTGMNNVVHVQAPDLDVDDHLPAGVAAWRIYRTFESGNYEDAALVHEVTEREDELDINSPLLVLWDDTGEETFDGVPLEISTTLTPSAAIAGLAGGDVISLVHRDDTPVPPVNGGALFVTNGALFFVGGAATVTQIAPA